MPVPHLELRPYAAAMRCGDPGPDHSGGPSRHNLEAGTVTMRGTDFMSHAAGSPMPLTKATVGPLTSGVMCPRLTDRAAYTI